MAYSVATLAAPLAVLSTWYWTITASHPDDQFPPPHGLIGNVATFSCIGAILCLALGPLASAAATPALFAGFVVAQRSTKLGSHRRVRHWTFLAHQLLGHHSMALLTLALNWCLRGIPWSNRR